MVLTTFSKALKMMRFNTMKNKKADTLGVILSAFCAIHCVLTPLVFLLPVFHVFEEGHHHWVHFSFFIFVAPLAIWTLILNSKFNWLSFLCGILGVSILAAAVAINFLHLEHQHSLDLALSLSGSGFLVLGHYLNLKL